MADRSWLSGLGLDVGGRCFDPAARGGAPRSEMRSPRQIGKGILDVVSRAESETANGRDSLQRFRAATTEKIFNFQEGDFYTEKMKTHPAIATTREEIREQLSDSCRLSCDSVASGKVHYSIGDKSLFGRAWQFLKDTVGYGTDGVIGSDPNFAVVGSFSTRSKWKTSGVDCERGFSSVDFSVSNNMGTESGSRFGYSPERTNNSVLGNDINGPTGEFGTVYQNWEWNEEVGFEANPSCKQVD
jgi:hypothetical protein